MLSSEAWRRMNEITGDRRVARGGGLEAHELAPHRRILARGGNGATRGDERHEVVQRRFRLRARTADRVGVVRVGRAPGHDRPVAAMEQLAEIEPQENVEQVLVDGRTRRDADLGSRAARGREHGEGTLGLEPGDRLDGGERRVRERRAEEGPVSLVVGRGHVAEKPLRDLGAERQRRRDEHVAVLAKPPARALEADHARDRAMELRHLEHRPVPARLRHVEVRIDDGVERRSERERSGRQASRASEARPGAPREPRPSDGGGHRDRPQEADRRRGAPCEQAEPERAGDGGACREAGTSRDLATRRGPGEQRARPDAGQRQHDQLGPRLHRRFVLHPGRRAGYSARVAADGSLGAAARIAVVIATVHRPADVVRAVASALESPFPRFEVIVVDQSGGAETRAGLEPLMADRRVRHTGMARRGLSAALNHGAASTEAELIAITGDDCTMRPDWLDAMARAFDGDPAVAVVFGHVASGPCDPAHGFVPGCDIDTPFTATVLEDLHRMSGTTACMAVRRRVWRDLGGFDETLGVGAPLRSGEDLDLALRALHAGIARAPDAGGGGDPSHGPRLARARHGGAPQLVRLGRRDGEMAPARRHADGACTRPPGPALGRRRLRRCRHLRAASGARRDAAGIRDRLRGRVHVADRRRSTDVSRARVIRSHDGVRFEGPEGAHGEPWPDARGRREPHVGPDPGHHRRRLGRVALLSRRHDRLQPEAEGETPAGEPRACQTGELRIPARGERVGPRRGRPLRERLRRQHHRLRRTRSHPPDLHAPRLRCDLPAGQGQGAHRARAEGHRPRSLAHPHAAARRRRGPEAPSRLREDASPRDASVTSHPPIRANTAAMRRRRHARVGAASVHICRAGFSRPRHAIRAYHRTQHTRVRPEPRRSLGSELLDLALHRAPPGHEQAVGRREAGFSTLRRRLVRRDVEDDRRLERQVGGRQRAVGAGLAAHAELHEARRLGEEADRGLVDAVDVRRRRAGVLVGELGLGGVRLPPDLLRRVVRAGRERRIEDVRAVLLLKQQADAVQIAPDGRHLRQDEEALDLHLVVAGRGQELRDGDLRLGGVDAAVEGVVARIADVALAVAVAVRLARICHQRAVVLGVAGTVPVAVGLAGVGRTGGARSGARLGHVARIDRRAAHRARRLELSAGQALLAPVQLSATSQAPAAERHAVPDGCFTSPGQRSLAPLQTSWRSHTSAAARQTVPDGSFASAGHASLTPSQRVGHVAPAARRAADHRRTLLAVGGTHGPDAVAEVVRVATVDRGRQSTKAPDTLSAGQSAPVPVQLSATSQSPAAERHTVVLGSKVSAGHAGPLPVQASATSHTPAPRGTPCPTR